MTAQAMRAGFGGGVVVDFPESTKAKKLVTLCTMLYPIAYYFSILRVFLILFAGGASNQLPTALDASALDEAEDAEHIPYSRNGPQRHHGKKNRAPVKSRKWVMDKKDRMRAKGLETRPDSKYTGRPRKHF